MQQHEIAQKIVDFLVKHGGIKAGEFDADAEIFADGAIDSFTVLELTIFIEDTFGVEIDEEQVGRLKSIGRIADRITNEANANGEVE
ncbi:acyl carrier protein [Burkholderia lata]|uniref:acyl carrier protein n=1 Tax=Burkholderia lata (strain ATCC 17760 / DSM 23089 / LMG 22485 / NCIMB 9086 / R18194 / 383) TaxID=482957 RepID=UPI00059F0201|nr:acyl carrier protein [Burkholderia lata]